MSDNDESSGRSKAWIWIGLLVGILIVLLTVPFMAMGVALTKACFTPLHGRETNPPSSLMTTNSLVGGDASGPMGSLRASLERAASSAIRLPQLNSKMKEIQILAPPASMTRATNEIHHILSDRKLQYVEAVETDRIRIVVIIKSKEWSELSGSLQTAIQKDGFIYRGPSQTATVGDQADSMVAEIEIIKRSSD
ncbi:MAG: hypothetical protein K8R57_09795 [Verrucomicrobia bacterium]|nr:hypothetical protein [Verrucomicrobiota bacterium]